MYSLNFNTQCPAGGRGGGDAFEPSAVLAQPTSGEDSLAASALPPRTFVRLLFAYIMYICVLLSIRITGTTTRVIARY